MFSFHDDIVYFSHCKGTTSKIPQFPKRHESACTCELLRFICPQIINLGTESHGFFSKDTALAPHHFNFLIF